MKTSIATVSISGDLAEKLEAIAAAGFDGVEIFENDLLVFDESPRTVGRMVRDAGLELTLYQPFRDFEGLPEPHRSRAFDRAERKFDVMAELGTDLMLVCSSVSPAALGGIDRLAADFAELGERAGKRGLRVGYEALAWGRFINDHRDAWEVVRRAAHPSVGLILDSFHTLARRIDVSSIRAIPADKIFIVQLADAPLLDMDLLSWSRHYRSMPGEGDLPVVEFMRAIAATGYDGVLSLEVFNDHFRSAAGRPVARDGHRSLMNLADEVRRREPGVKLSLPSMPARQEALGLEFIEFASSDDAAEELTSQLAALGFAEAGRHRNKAVSRWVQGDINIVVNRETSGLAHSAFLAHGLSAYAMGLRVNDAAETMARAAALGADVFSQPLGPGEMPVPAIRGLGGGLVYFVDDGEPLTNLWTNEFPEGGGVAPGIGLTRVDHVAQTMEQSELLTWLLFYTSLLDTRKSAPMDIADPAGLIRSQVIENPDRSLRITMNGAENRNTVAGAFLADSFGSGIQHVAFATDDIFATAEAALERGFRPLHISPNYYDDVEARFALAPEVIERLRSLNILYDRDATGEYFQLFTPLIAGGFFFEIVERRNYDGYGAPNAMFRIAAQRKALRPSGIPRPR